MIKIISQFTKPDISFEADNFIHNIMFSMLQLKISFIELISLLHRGLTSSLLEYHNILAAIELPFANRYAKC